MMMICMPERGSVNTKSQISTPRIIMQRHLTHPKFQHRLTYQLRKRGTHQEPHRSVPKKFFFKWNRCDVTDTRPHMEPDVEESSEQPNISPTNPCSSNYNLHHDPKPNCNDDYR